MAIFSFDKTNKKNYKKRGDYGVRVARPGYDAENCAQNQLIFNSSWPILQIAKVIDLDKKADFEYKYWDTQNKVWLDDADISGLSGSYGIYSSNIAVNKNHLIYTEEAVGFLERTAPYTIRYWRFKYKKYYHGLGYTPFFFLSEEVSDTENKVILTSVDVSRDIDYPYTEGALPLISKIGDYGISSTSCFNNPRVPGLCSNMFSKLVQAVKTNESSRWIIPYEPGGTEGDKVLCWSPFDKESEVVEGEVNKYEAFAFGAFRCPFLEMGLAENVINFGGEGVDSDPFGNSLYYSREAYVHMVGLTENSLYDSAVAYTNLGQAPILRDDASLVILRSPMVSPEYEEVRI